MTLSGFCTSRKAQFCLLSHRSLYCALCVFSFVPFRLLARHCRHCLAFVKNKGVFRGRKMEIVCSISFDFQNEPHIFCFPTRAQSDNFKRLIALNPLFDDILSRCWKLHSNYFKSQPVEYKKERKRKTLAIIYSHCRAFKYTFFAEKAPFLPCRCLVCTE